MLADVVLPGRRFQIFTYQIPTQWRTRIRTGSPVVVPLGSGVVSGVVVRTFDPPDSSAVPLQFRHGPLRPILSLESAPEHPPLEQSLLRLVEKISAYYLAPLSACLRLVVPPRAFPIMKRVWITGEGRSALTRNTPSVEIRSLLQKLEHAPNGLLRSSLIRAMKDASAVLKDGKRKGWITERTTLPSGSGVRNQREKSRGGSQKPDTESPGLFDLPGPNPAHLPQSIRENTLGLQDSLEHQLEDAARTEGFQEIPVVGSDRRRWHLLVQVLEVLGFQGRQTLILTPEVHQAEALGAHLRSVCQSQVEVYHAHLSTAIRSARWEWIRQGCAQIIVGTRSAVFLPLPNLGLLWIEHEQDPSYKEERLPYYHTREVAAMRGECEKIPVIYGSACPSLEVYGRFKKFIGGSLAHQWQQVSPVTIIDSRTLVYGTIISPELLAMMTQALNQGEQVILLLNRKGFSGALLCRDCGLSPTCSTCNIPMKLYHRPSRLICSYCENSREPPEACSACQGRVFRFSGPGTQRLEEEVLRLFPAVSVARFDGEAVKSTEAAQAMLHQFRERAIQVLVGTELLLHQPDPPTAGVVGLPYADLGMHLPDFRSAERTFQMLSKIVTLTYNGRENTHVLLQTRLPEHYVFTAVSQQRPQVFYDQELDLREGLGYPPFCHVILLVVTGVQASRVQKVVEFLGPQLRSCETQGAPPEGKPDMLNMPRLLGPIVSKKTGRSQSTRMLFLIKTFNLPETQQVLQKIQRTYESMFSKEPVILEINVDPIVIQ